MNTNQLKSIFSCDGDLKKRVVGIFASDQIPKNVRELTGFIVNTDPISKPGQHWIAFYVNKQRELECFDSYGNSSDLYSSSIKHFIRRYDKVTFNNKRLQGDKTSVCGQYCVFFLWCRIKERLSIVKIGERFTSDYDLNDRFVFDFVNDKLSQCVMLVEQSQICISKNKC